MKMKAFKHYGTVAALAVIILIFSILRPASFCTVKNFLNISRQAAPLAMVALGATFVMTINEFDLSVGNIVSLGGVIAALLSIRQVPVVLCFLTAALICLLVGCINGIVVARFQILSFITTLGMGTVLDGVIYCSRSKFLTKLLKTFDKTFREIFPVFISTKRRVFPSAFLTIIL